MFYLRCDNEALGITFGELPSTPYVAFRVTIFERAIVLIGLSSVKLLSLLGSPQYPQLLTQESRLLPEPSQRCYESITGLGNASVMRTNVVSPVISSSRGRH